MKQHALIILLISCSNFIHRWCMLACLQITLVGVQSGMLIQFSGDVTAILQRNQLAMSETCRMPVCVVTTSQDQGQETCLEVSYSAVVLTDWPSVLLSNFGSMQLWYKSCSIIYKEVVSHCAALTRLPTSHSTSPQCSPLFSPLTPFPSAIGVQG